MADLCLDDAERVFLSMQYHVTEITLRVRTELSAQ
jgi:hypothetical protein